MNKIIQTDQAPPSFSSYAQAVESPFAGRMIHVSGQVGITVAGELPPTAAEQNELAWRNVFAILAAAGFDKTDIVDVLAIVRDHAGVPVYREIRDRMLDGHIAGSTMLVCGLANPEWQVEIAVKAVKSG